jgi:uncharacterized Zn-finger protein
LIPFAVEIVTVITVILVGAILTVYFLVLKKNGWIGEASNYRCPNPQCRKIFQVPMKVKDFSTKKEVGLACPECGCDLGPLKGGKGLKETTLQSGPELKIRDSVSILIGARGSAVNGGTKEPEPALEAAHPTFESEKNPTKQSTVQTARQPGIVKNTTINQVDVKEKKSRFTCPTCKKEFSTPLFTLEYAATGPKLIRHCPYCDQRID